MATLLSQQESDDFAQFLDSVERSSHPPAAPVRPSSNPYHSPLDSLDDAVRQRMAQQTADLKAWMAHKSTPPPVPPAYHPAPPAQSQLPSPPQNMTSKSAPQPSFVWDMDRSMNAIERMRQAELKGGFGKRQQPRQQQQQHISPDQVLHDMNSGVSAGMMVPSTSAATVLAPVPTHAAPSAPHTKPRIARSSSTKSKQDKAAASGSAGGGSKPALLTDAQKRANHIMSEQRRRAAIREGYDGLCQTVPALRAAVQDLESRKRGKRKHGVLMGGIQVGGEKIDGRAGPKSEAVVLSKSVEYLRELLDERQALLDRLSRSYDACRARGINVQPPPEGRTWELPWDQVKGDVASHDRADDDEEEEEDDEMWTDQE